MIENRRLSCQTDHHHHCCCSNILVSIYHGRIKINDRQVRMIHELRITATSAGDSHPLMTSRSNQQRAEYSKIIHDWVRTCILFVCWCSFLLIEGSGLDRVLSILLDSSRRKREERDERALQITCRYLMYYFDGKDTRTTNNNSSTH